MPPGARGPRSAADGARRRSAGAGAAIDGSIAPSSPSRSPLSRRVRSAPSAATASSSASAKIPNGTSASNSVPRPVRTCQPSARCAQLGDQRRLADAGLPGHLDRTSPAAAGGPQQRFQQRELARSPDDPHAPDDARIAAGIPSRKDQGEPRSIGVVGSGTFPGHANHTHPPRYNRGRARHRSRRARGHHGVAQERHHRSRPRRRLRERHRHAVGIRQADGRRGQLLVDRADQGHGRRRHRPRQRPRLHRVRRRGPVQSRRASKA